MYLCNLWRVRNIQKHPKIYAVVRDGETLVVKIAYFTGRFDREHRPVVWVKETAGCVEKFSRKTIDEICDGKVFCWVFSEVRAHILCEALAILRKKREEKVVEK